MRGLCRGLSVVGDFLMSILSYGSTVFWTVILIFLSMVLLKRKHF